MVKRARKRPGLLLELGALGTVDPFLLDLREEPSGSGRHLLLDPSRAGASIPLELGELNLVGAGQALFRLSLEWLERAGRAILPFDPPPASGEIRFILKRKEARLLAALLRRHLSRLPEPPGWMPELLRSMEEIDEFLRWEEA